MPLAHQATVGGEGPVVALTSQSSSLARCARLGERVELVDRPDQAVADREILRRLDRADGVCLPLIDAAGGGSVLGVVVFGVVVLLSMLATISFDPHAIWEEDA